MTKEAKLKMTQIDRALRRVSRYAEAIPTVSKRSVEIENIINQWYDGLLSTKEMVQHVNAL